MYCYCSTERGIFANCGQSGKHWLPKDHQLTDKQFNKFCAHCNVVLSLLFGAKEQIPEGITVGDVREKYACLGGDCPDLKTFGRKL